MFLTSVSINICATPSSLKSLNTSNWLLIIESVVKTLHVVTQSAGDVFLTLLVVALLIVWLHVDSCGVKDSKSAYTINAARIDLL